MTTHYLYEAQEMCNRIAIINKGRLVALDTTQKLLEWIETKKIHFKIRKSKNTNALSLSGVKFNIESDKIITATYEKSFKKFEEILNLLKKTDIQIQDISTEDGDLEDVFVQLTNS